MPLVRDFNGDGKPDIAVENVGTHDVSVLLGNGDGTFQPAASYDAGTGPGGLAAGDFNGDGILDLAVVNHFSHNISVLLGRGDGAFRPAEHYALGDTPAGVAVGDFNGDGRLDLAVVNHFSHSVSVLLNQLPSPHLRITANRTMAAGADYHATVTALDAWNNTDPAFTNTVLITSSDPRAIISDPLQFSRGMDLFRVTFRTAGPQTLTVVDAANPSCHGRIKVVVTPRAAVAFRVSAAADVAAGKPCAITVTAVDEFDNDTESTGAVRLTSDAPGAILPGDYLFTERDNGTHVFQVIFPREGQWSVRVADATREALAGSAKVTVGK